MIIVAIAVVLCTAYLLWQLISADLVEPDYGPPEDVPTTALLEDGPPRWLLNSGSVHDLAELEVGATAQPD
jgi:hypothetical protein